MAPSPPAPVSPARPHAVRPGRGDPALLQRGGDPAVPTTHAKVADGVKFYLSDGSRTDIVALNLPCFFVRTPEDFHEFTRARKPDPATGQPDLEKVGAFLSAHPEAGRAIQAALSDDPPESYATCAYN